MTPAVLRVKRDHPEDEGEKPNGESQRKRPKKRSAAESRAHAS